jgi:hypothetical protein
MLKHSGLQHNSPLEFTAIEPLSVLHSVHTQRSWRVVQCFCGIDSPSGVEQVWNYYTPSSCALPGSGLPKDRRMKCTDGTFRLRTCSCCEACLHLLNLNQQHVTGYSSMRRVPGKRTFSFKSGSCSYLVPEHRLCALQLPIFADLRKCILLRWICCRSHRCARSL